MLRFLLSPALVLVMASGSLAATARFDVQGMVCESCAEDIKTSLTKLAGIRSVAVDLEHARVTVSYDSRKVSPTRILEAIDGYGFEVKLIPKPAK